MQNKRAVGDRGVVIMKDRVLCRFGNSLVFWQNNRVVCDVKLPRGSRLALLWFAAHLARLSWPAAAFLRDCVQLATIGWANWWIVFVGTLKRSENKARQQWRQLRLFVDARLMTPTLNVVKPYLYTTLRLNGSPRPITAPPDINTHQHQDTRH